MARDKSDHLLAEYQMAKYNQSVLDTVIEKEKELKELTKKVTSSLQEIIINEIENHEEISFETDKRFEQVTDILNTASSKEGNDLLIIARRDLRLALHPKPPYNFPDPYEVGVCFINYRNILDKAIGLNAQSLATILKEGTKSSYYKRIEDRIGLLKESIHDIRKLNIEK